MRTSADMPRRPRRSANRRRVLFIGGAAAIIVVFGLSSSIAGFYTDYLWYSDLGVSTVFTTVLGAKSSLVAIFTALAFLLVYANLQIAARLAPKGPRLGPDDEVVERFREAAGVHIAKLRVAVAVLLALLLGSGVKGRWQDYLLWRNRVSFHTADPQFHKDVGFYIFDLPFRSFVVSWFIAALIATAIFTTVAHYLNGGIRLQSAQHRGAAPAVKAHLSVLLVGVALGKAYGYYLERFELVFSNRGFGRGAFYTDVNAKLPALGLLTLISLAAGVLLLVNIQRRGFALPAVALGMWLFVSILVGGVYPALIQQFKVKPAESRLEATYIQRNIDATRKAFGLDKVELKNFDYTDAPGAVNPAVLQREAQTIRNIRLWDPDHNISQQTFERLQSLKDYYQVLDVDIARYPIDGEPTQVVSAVRELQPEKLPQDNWVNRHLQYTHGYGAVIAPANSATKEGFPAFTLKDLPPNPPLAEPRIYVGEQNSAGDYAIVNTKQTEIDFQKADGSNETSSYQGRRGVGLSSTARRLAFALRFREINVMISSFVTPESKVLYVRSVKERVEKVAPFLTLDHDPYAVVLDGKIKWIVDGYTTSDRYPYAQSIGGVPGGLAGVSYVRNSVKIVVDAYDGSVDLYVIDPADPMVQAYKKAFPGLFKEKAQMPAGLEAQFRYPEDLFTLQADLYGRYHITDASQFFSATDRWNISPDPGVTAVSRAATTPAAPTGGATSNTVPTRRLSSGASNRIPAAYQLQKLPGDAKESFSILLPYVPFSKDNGRQQLTAFLSAHSDPGAYGRLVLYRMTGQQINGPALIDSIIKSDTAISQEVSLLNQQGSEVLFGNVLLVPIDSSIIYIRPLYTQATENKLPKLVRVIAVYGNRAEMRNTLKDALTALFGDAPATLEQGPDGGPTTTPGTTTSSPGLGSDVAALLAKADAAFTEAQAALTKGDLATYQKKVDEARDAVRQAKAAQAGGPTTTAPATTPTTAASG
jgi:uncharacterized membrane protein (UPF0182 family)